MTKLIDIEELCTSVSKMYVAQEDLKATDKLPLKEGYKLFPHQVQAIEWMKQRELFCKKEVNGGTRKCGEKSWGLKGGIMCQTMGLGKTLTALAYTLQNKSSFPTLVVASKMILSEWKTEGVEKFFNKDDVKVLYLHKDYLGKDIDNVDRDTIMKYDIVMTTYDVCMSSCRKGQYYLQCLEIGEDDTMQKGKVVAIHPRKRKDANIPNLKGVDVIYGTPWERVFCDESQRFANPLTMTYKYILAIYGRYKWCLTGTPIRNYETDIWTQLRFCGYNGVERAVDWRKHGHTVFKEHKLRDAILMIDYDSAKIQLPEKHEHIIKVTMDGYNSIEIEKNNTKRTLSDNEETILAMEDGYHKSMYISVLDEARKAYLKACGIKNIRNYSKVLETITTLRQVAISPYVTTHNAKRGNKSDEIEDPEPEETAVLEADDKGTWHCDDGSEFETYVKANWERLNTEYPSVFVETSANLTKLFSIRRRRMWRLKKNSAAGIYSNKIQAVINLIEKIKNEEGGNKGETPKIIVFSMFASVLDLIGDAIKKDHPNLKFSQIDGGTKNRQELFENFKTDTTTTALLMTYKVGSEGLNLTEATHCICVEPWWTDSVMSQAKARCWRTGQTKPVHMYNIITEGSIEEKIVEICGKKKEMADVYLQGTTTTTKFQRPKLDMKTLGKLLGMDEI
jgi:SNF2 family DNA or RNA helicase